MKRYRPIIQALVDPTVDLFPQEFSIEIPDKEADAIHSGMHYHTLFCQLAKLSLVDKAVEYIISQPDGKSYTHDSKPVANKNAAH